MSMIAVAVSCAIAAAAVAQLPAPYDAWGQGPAKHLMTKEEARVWAAIRTEADAKNFVDLFWAKRDPTPTTERNEFRLEFDQRVAAADQSFTTTKTRGSMTDRGRALILLGSPFTVGSVGGARAAANDAVRAETAKLTWAYRNDKKPKFIARKDFEILFSDERGGGEYEFAKTPRVNPEALLQEAVAAYIISPNLTAVPSYGTTTAAATPGRSKAFRDAALQAAYEKFKAEQKPVGTAHLTWGEYVTPEGEGFVPVSLYVPASPNVPANRKVTFFGVIENAAGEVVEVHEEDATLIATARDAYIDKSLRLEPGKYNATFGVAEGGKPLALTRTEVTVQGLKPEDTAVSQLILSNNAFPLPQAQKRTDPYAFGGFKVVPKGDATFAPSDDLWYFMELRNPGVADTGAPKVMVKLDVTGKTDDGKPVNLNFPLSDVETLPLKDVKNHYALVQAFPLADFKPGSYTIKVKVIDSVLKKNYEEVRQFQVRNL
jgi:GWxTD domain-containing protein